MKPSPKMVEVYVVNESLEKSLHVRESKLEILYERLENAKDPKQKKAIIEEIETVTGIKLIYD
jgi:hypothetical protein